ncbi:MAG TPA: cation-translocating P-type ATPase [Nocardioides sp.]|nr:cation-translocating P-type ATPase [Nocardioides sp.]
MNIGLGSAEAVRLLAELGPNVAPRPPRRSATRRVLDQLRDPMILMLLGAFVVVAGVGDIADGAIILAVVTLNTTIGVVQEVRAANALDALEQLAAPHAVVVRDGHPVRVAAADVVPGDVVRLEAGDVVPADLDLELAAGLQVDESTMTGESVPVTRQVGEQLFAGTVVTRGRAHGTAVRTGSHSALGAIAASVAAAGVRPTPLQQRLSRLSGQLVVATLALAFVVFLLGVLRGEDVAHTLVLAVSLAVAAIPESLPAVVTVALALGAYRMSRRHALVRRLPAVETLGSVTVLASDKTGTLTEGRMTVRERWIPPGGDRAALDRDLVLCNDAGDVAGDPMEVALLAAAVEADPAALDARDRWPRVGEVPFESETKRMTTLHRGPGGRLLVCKGAPESVLPLVADTGAAEAGRAEAHRLAEQGYRVLAAADSVPDGPTPDLASPGGLTLRGLVALVDPPRASARDVVVACRDAGIRVVMITGDHPSTARSIADELTITDDAPELALGGHAADVARVGVYARTRPEEKVDIVAAWQDLGAVVAMTGDGVNDAPALRNADIGIAMGGRGTEVARQAADLVLGDDDLRTVVAAVEEGRRIYTNIRRFLRFGLAGGLAEVLVLLLGPFLGIPLPLTPGQILWINMVTHGLPGVAFGGEPADPADMARPSPSPERSVLGGLVRQIGSSAVMITAVSLGVALSVGATGQQQTSVFLCLGLAQLWLALALRAPRAGAGWRDRGLEAAVTAAALLLVAAVAWAPLRDLLDTAPVTWQRAALVAAVAAVPALVVAAWSRFVPGAEGPLARTAVADDTAGRSHAGTGGSM